MAPKPRDRGNYRCNERVLVPHVDKFYVAKVTKCEKREDGWYYLLHYQGWNKKWDEWVEAGGLTKYDVKLITAGDGAATAHDGSGVAGGSAHTSGAATTATKRKAAEQPASPVVTMAGSPPAKLEVELSPELRQVLIADWERTMQGKPRPLPQKPTVAEILAGYVKAAKKQAAKKDVALDIEEELVAGLTNFFDIGLPQMLLYASERQQYDETIAQQVQTADDALPKPSKLYGGEHLLRLLTKLPDLLPVTNLPAADYNTLQTRLMDFVKHLQTQRSTVFMKALHA